MNDQTLIANSRQLVIAIETVAQRHRLTDADTVSLCCITISEMLAGKLGPVGAIEHLRDVADALERHLLN